MTHDMRYAMPALILPLVDAATHWPARGALVGLDLGTKTIGVAVSDPDRRLATGVETIQRKAFKQDAARLLAIGAERKAVGLVLGLPINMDGSEGPRAEKSRAVAARLTEATGLDVVLWDERRSSVEAHAILHANGRREKKHRERVDAVAASLILEGYLGTLGGLRL